MSYHGHDSECESRQDFTVHDGIKYCDGCSGALDADDLLYDSDYDDPSYLPSWLRRD